MAGALAAAGLVGYVVGAVAGPGAGIIAAASVAFATGTAIAWPSRRPTTRWTSLGLAVLLGAVIVYLSFNSGGYFPGPTALVALLFAVLLLLRLALADRPISGLSWPLAAAAGLLALFAVWQAASATWSVSPARASVEVDRTLLYLFVLLFFGSFARPPERLRAIVRGLAMAIVVVCLAGLAFWLFPDRFPFPGDFAPNRLNYPLTYWNALGLLAAIGTILSVHLAVGESEPRWARIAGSIAVPLCATVTYFTFSRGGLGAAVIGLVVYLVFARPRRLLTGGLAVIPTTAVAVFVASRADVLASEQKTVAEAAAQGAAVAPIIAVTALAAGLLRANLLAFDGPLSEAELSRWTRTAGAVAGVGAALIALLVAVALGVPGQVSQQVDRFFAGTNTEQGTDARARLLDPSNNGRVGYWRVARRNHSASPLVGHGAGTFVLMWERDREGPLGFAAEDGHSVYFETLAELGYVGFFLLLGCLGVFFVRLVVASARGPGRAVYAAVLAAAAAWAIRAGIDWDWEVPAVTVWLFALAGVALARRSGGRRGRLPLPVRIAVIAVVAVVALVPARLVVFEQRLDAAQVAFEASDCRTSRAAARDATDVIASRPEPYELLAYCGLRERDYRGALSAGRGAVERDPRSWRYRWGLAVAEGAAGGDPRPSIGRARRLNPLEPQVAALERPRSTAEWRRVAPALVQGFNP